MYSSIYIYICKNGNMYIYIHEFDIIWTHFWHVEKNIYAAPVYSNGHIIYSFKDDIHILYIYIRYFIWWDTHDTMFPHLQEMDGTNIKTLRIFLVIAVVPSKERLPSMTQRLVRHTSQSQRRRRWESQAKKTSNTIPWAAATEVMLASRF